MTKRYTDCEYGWNVTGYMASLKGIQFVNMIGMSLVIWHDERYTVCEYDWNVTGYMA